MEKILYFDNNSTTQTDIRVIEAMMPYLTSKFANASSKHLIGVEANEAVKVARKNIARFIGAEPHEIVFTSGATESINLGLIGLSGISSSEPIHIISVNTEHNAVLDTCEFLGKLGHEITYLNVSSNGLIDIQELKDSFKKNTKLVCVMLANNETGVIQPIRQIASIAHENNCLIMTDATQGVGKMSVNVDDLDVDLLCFSGHKFYGPKGIGVLFIRSRGRKIKLTPLIHGGGHERGLRSGTLNVAGIVGLGKACELLEKELPRNIKHMRSLSKTIEEGLLAIEGAFLNANYAERLPNTLNFRFQDIDSDALIMGLGSYGDDNTVIAISNGSACNSEKISPSHVLLAMGLDEKQAYSSVRISIGKDNTVEEAEYLIKAISSTIEYLRGMI